MIKKIIDRKKIGKQNRAKGARFELAVRKNLESKGWIVDRWSNNVEFEKIYGEDVLKKKIDVDKISWNIESKEIYDQGYIGKLISAKHKFRGPGIPMAIGTGFPDFIAFKKWHPPEAVKQAEKAKPGKPGIYLSPYPLTYTIYGVECKSNSYLTKEEKEKCKWYLENNVFSKILIVKKGKKRGEIIYEEFKNEDKSV